MKYALRNLFRRKIRTAMAIVGIAVGVSAVIALISVSDGIMSGIRSILREFPGDLIVVQRDSLGLENSEIDEDLVEIIATDENCPPDIEWAEGIVFDIQLFAVHRLLPDRLWQAVEKTEANQKRALPLFGYSPEGQGLASLEIVEGRTFSAEPESRNADGTFRSEVLLSRTFAERFEMEAGRRGLAIDIEPGIVWEADDGEEWELVGIYKAHATLMETAVVLPLETAQRYFHHEGEVSMICIQLAPHGNKERVRKYIRSIAGKERLDCMPPEEYIDTFANDLDRIDDLIYTIGLIAAFAGAIGVLNTMMSNVHERTREIGVLRAVGWSRTMVVSTILVEGFALSLVGGLLAIVLAVAEIAAAEFFILQFNPLPEGFDLQVFGLGLALALTLGLVGSLIPAFFASRLEPVEALRYE